MRGGICYSVHLSLVDSLTNVREIQKIIIATAAVRYIHTYTSIYLLQALIYVTDYLMC